MKTRKVITSPDMADVHIIGSKKTLLLKSSLMFSPTHETNIVQIPLVDAYANLSSGFIIMSYMLFYFYSPRALENFLLPSNTIILVIQDTEVIGQVIHRIIFQNHICSRTSRLLALNLPSNKTILYLLLTLVHHRWLLLFRL